MTTKFFILYWLVCMFLASCKAHHDPKQDIISAFEALSKTVNEDYLIEIKLSQHDSTGKSLERISYEIDSIYTAIMREPEVATFLDSIVPEESKYQKLYLKVAFQAFLNEQDISSKDIGIDMNRIYEYNIRIQYLHD